jgi:hypothetical protein
MKAFKKIWDAIKTPFESLIAGLDESKRINEDGSWDKYHARKNRKERG